MKIVVALGGNALLRRGEVAEASVQERHVTEAAAALAPLVDAHEIVITHGNGPQVGLLALEAESYREVKPYPLDVLGAESQGMIGYLLANGLSARSRKTLGVVMTRVEVSDDDPAFAAPTKPIGPIYDEPTATRLATERGWHVRRDGASWRRVVASPEPRMIVELPVIRDLLDGGIAVVAAGGGGVPVVQTSDGYAGVQAVIDKDLTASLLARELAADRLLILTDVPGVAAGWGSASQRYIAKASTEALRSMTFASGSMAPKIEACNRFAEETGRPALIGAMEDVERILSGEVGTLIEAGAGDVEMREAA